MASNILFWISLCAICDVVDTFYISIEHVKSRTYSVSSNSSYAVPFLDGENLQRTKKSVIEKHGCPRGRISHANQCLTPEKYEEILKDNESLSGYETTTKESDALRVVGLSHREPEIVPETTSEREPVPESNSQRKPKNTPETTSYRESITKSESTSQQETGTVPESTSQRASVPVITTLGDREAQDHPPSNHDSSGSSLPLWSMCLLSILLLVFLCFADIYTKLVHGRNHDEYRTCIEPFLADCDSATYTATIH